MLWPQRAALEVSVRQAPRETGARAQDMHPPYHEVVTVRETGPQRGCNTDSGFALAVEEATGLADSDAQ